VFVDEEVGGVFGSYWFVDYCCELFDVVIEVISEVGGYLVMVDGCDGDLVCLYLL